MISFSIYYISRYWFSFVLWVFVVESFKPILIFTDSVIIIAVDGGYENEFKKGKRYATTTWRQLRKTPQITKLTKQQIADKFELDVNLIEIV